MSRMSGGQIDGRPRAHPQTRRRRIFPDIQPNPLRAASEYNCPGCRAHHGRLSDTHNHIPGDCKWADPGDRALGRSSDIYRPPVVPKEPPIVTTARGSPGHEEQLGPDESLENAGVPEAPQQGGASSSTDTPAQQEIAVGPDAESQGKPKTPYRKDVIVKADAGIQATALDQHPDWARWNSGRAFSAFRG